jgi:N6-L-threonylcarbamoyladenine synthase
MLASLMGARILGIECTFNNCCVAVMDERGVMTRGAEFASEMSMDEDEWRDELAAFHRRTLAGMLQELATRKFDRVYLSIDAGQNNRNVAEVQALLSERGLAWTSVDHATAHLYGTLFEHRVEPPFIGLTIAASHSSLHAVQRIGEHTLIGSHERSPHSKFGIGRPVGAALDACAAILGFAPLGQPDGAIAIDKLGELPWEGGDPIPKTTTRNTKNGYDFDMSPLMHEVLARARPSDRGSNERLAVAVQRSIVRILLDKTFRAARELGVPRIVFGGGVAANSHLRRQAAERAAQEGCRVYFPSPVLCTDNAVMIAFTGKLLER